MVDVAMEEAQTDAVREENMLLEDLPLEKLYEYFSLQASDLPEVLRSFQALKEKLGIRRLTGVELYRALKLTLATPKVWKAKEVFALLEKRANQKEYEQQTAAKGVRVLIVGAGPVGMRLAIDCVLLGAKVAVVEKRLSYSRNNVLHLWPCTIEDLKQLGAKKFYGKFCAGAIDHISIRSLQCILLKVCLLLGVQIYTGVEFQEILEPTETVGWHATFNPSDHPINQFEFDVLCGADGRRSTIPGFDRKELRGKLALAITANFVNYRTREESAVDEISGVAFIFNQKFFKDLTSDTGIDLENIVYYRDDTHYFVMTAKKDSLLKKRVLHKDYSETRELLHPRNINREALYEYAREAADWSTDLPQLDFALNHYDKPDVALFDFTSIYQAEYAARAIRRGGRDLYLCVVGDALLEPFWPTGTGCPRGFLSAMDTAWLIKGVAQRKKPLDLLCEREKIFCLLPQTIPERLNQNIKAYTIDPQTRYPNLHRKVRHSEVKHLYDVEDDVPTPVSLRQGSIKVKRLASAASEDDEEMKENIPESKKAREELSLVASPSRRPLMEKGSIHLAYYSEPNQEMSLREPAVLLGWARLQLKEEGVEVSDLSSSWSNGMALCALIHRYHPELIPNYDSLSPTNAVENNQLAFSVAEERLGITSLLKPTEMEKPDRLALFTYLSLFYEFFLNKEPAPKVDIIVEPPPGKSRKDRKTSKTGKTTPKRKSLFSRKMSRNNFLATSPPSVERNWNTQTVKRRISTSPPPPESPMETAPPTKAVVARKPAPRAPRPKSQFGNPTNSSDFCYFCTKRVYLMERMSANGFFFHRSCFRCSHCNCQLKIGGYSLSKGDGGERGKFFCTPHYRQLFLSNPEAINYSRAGASKRESRVEEVVQPAIREEEPVKRVPQQEPVKPVSPVEPAMRTSEDEVMRAIVEDEEEIEVVKTPVKEVPDPLRPVKLVLPESSIEMEEEEEPWEVIEVSSTMVEVRVENGEWEEEARGSAMEVETQPPRVLSTPVSSQRSRKLAVEGSNVRQLLEGFERRDAAARGYEYEPPPPPIPPRPTASPPTVPTVTSPEEEELSGIWESERPPPDGPSLLTSSLPGNDQRRGSGSYRPPTLALLQEAFSGSGIAPKWYQFGLKLNLTSSELHSVERKCRGKPLFQFLSEMLRIWLEKSPVWSTMVRALRGIEENELADKIKDEYGDVTPVVVVRRPRSPCEWRGPGVRKVQPEDYHYLPRSSQNLSRPTRKGRGQQSLARPMITTYDTSDVAIQDRRKQQQRFREAQLIQREMSQLERQYEELEEVGREIEQALRDANETTQEDNFMMPWLNLVNERNGLVRKTAELSLKMKELELEDKQYEIDKELNDLASLEERDWTRQMKARFEELCDQKVKVVEERNEVVMQTEEERIRELEEDERASTMLDERFGLVRRDSTGSASSSSSSPETFMRRRPSEPAPELQVEAILNKKRPKRWSIFGFSRK